MGIQLLRGLGWKEGQGIGPRVRRRKKHKKGGPKMYGCAMPPTGSTSESSEEGDFLPENVTFAPKDVNPVNLDPKANLHGLGYSGINRDSVFGNDDHFSLFEAPAAAVSRTTGKKGIRGMAFGVGMMEDDDDMDIYTTDNMSKYDRMLGGPEGDTHHGWTAPSHRGEVQNAIATLNQILAGFKLSSRSAKSHNIYPLPQLPRGFRPLHRFDNTAGGAGWRAPGTGSRESVVPPGSEKRKDQQLDAGARAEILGETPQIKSVFELVSKEDQAKIAQVRATKPTNVLIDAHKAKKEVEASSKPDSGSASHAPPSKDNPKTVTTSSDKDASKGSNVAMGSTLYKVGTGFKPFAKDDAKQQRYEEYLAATKKGETYPSCDDVRLTEWETQKEVGEFLRAAQLYRPLSSVMASRFTRAQYDDDTDKAKVEYEKTESSEKKAAEMNMYGKLTREAVEWHPDKLLCKRFNIPNPYPDSAIVGVPRIRRDKFSVFNLLGLPPSEEEEARMKQEEEERLRQQEQALEARKQKKSGSGIKPLAILATMDLRTASQKAGEQEVSKEVTMETGGDDGGKQTATSAPQTVGGVDVSKKDEDGRPSMDLFRAIFADSESSSSDSEEDEDQGDKQQEEKPVGVIQVESLEDRLSPAAMHSFTPPSPSNKTPQPSTSSHHDNHSYGPSVPPPASELPSSSMLESPGLISSGSMFEPPGSKFESAEEVSRHMDERVEKDSGKERHRKHKNRHKEKSHKHKKKKSSSKHKKHKKEKRKKHKKDKKKKKKKNVVDISSESSSDDSSDSEEEEEQLPTDKEIIKKLSAFW